jgi:hypothetical protein
MQILSFTITQEILAYAILLGICYCKSDGILIGRNVVIMNTVVSFCKVLVETTS